MSEPVLVLDGAQRSALAVVRSLGRAGLKVHVGESQPASLAGRSRCCAASVMLPDPCQTPDQFVAAVSSAAERIGTGLVIPVTDASTMLLVAADHKPGRDFCVAAAPQAAYERLTDKALATRLAREVGIPVPETWFATSADEMHTAARHFGFPCVLKPARSWVRQGDRLASTSVSIARGPSDLEDPRLLETLALMPLMVQEFIPGTGAGVFAMYGPKGPVAWFEHRRLREKPPAGGVSVLCESVAVDPILRDYAERLLSAAGWFGPAMVEFRVDPQGRPWLMEVNGRFWGSLQLAIDCGVDFPRLLYDLCLGREVRGPDAYPVGRRLRWLLGDFDHLILQLRGKGTADTAGARLATLGAFMNFFSRDTRFEVLRRDDPAPFRHELRRWFGALR